MFLLGICLFLRADELVSLEVEDFIHSYHPQGKERLNGDPGHGRDKMKEHFIVHATNIEALAVEVQGKKDQRPVLLMLLSNDKYPELCPVRTLLWYMHVFDIKGGYLFPDDQSLIHHWQEQRGVGWEPTTRIKYTPFLRLISKLVKTVCKRDVARFTVGTHTMRKTAYLIAIWGILSSAEQASLIKHSIPHLYLNAVMFTARHKSVANANTYQRDCMTLFELTKRERFDESNRVAPFQSI
jgi:hypothetical protein